MSRSSWIRATALGCFLLTGCTGLIYELVWVRMLILSFGSTQFAVSTVLAIFMGGLAIGSLVFGRIVDRLGRPLALFGVLEIALGAYCLLTPFLFEAIRAVYLSISSPGDVASAGFDPTQFMLSAAAIILPSTLMGGTLPVLTTYFATREDSVGLRVGILYAVNTLGSVVGCLATGLFLLYLLGVDTTIYLAGMLDIAIGAFVLVLSHASDEAAEAAPEAAVPDFDRDLAAQRSGREEPRGGEVRRITPAVRRIVIGVFAVSGFAALVYEVLWTRILSLIIGSSIYAFSIMLATFLFGIGVGSILFAPFIDRRSKPLVWFAVLEIAIGLSTLVAIPLYKELPFVFLELQASLAERFWLFLAAQFGLCAMLMLVPTLCMGAIFPTVSRIYASSLDSIGRKIGTVYFFNTIGGITGSLVGGFVMIPHLGVQPSIVWTATLSTLLGLVLIGVAPVPRIPRGVAIVVASALFVAAYLHVPPWNATVMTMGAYVNPLPEKALDALRESGAHGELLYYREGVNATITVRREADGRTISYQSNGKYEAKTIDSKPGKAWSLLGHIPMLLADEAESALLVGIGSGITLGSMEQYPLKEIDVVEIEPAVVEAARFFDAASGHALDDPRVTIHTTDGRNFLARGEDRYDVIVSAVADPWITGVSNLFTAEYFAEVRGRLADQGVVALWFQNYRISDEELEIGLATFASVFPHVSLWVHPAQTSDLIVIGMNHELEIDMEALSDKLGRERVRRDLARIGIGSPYEILNLFLMGNADLRRATAGAPLNLDDRPILEFALPKLLNTDLTGGANERIVDLVDQTRDFWPPVREPENPERYLLRLGTTYAGYAFRTRHAIAVFEKVLDLNPDNQQAERYLAALRRIARQRARDSRDRRADGTGPR